VTARHTYFRYLVGIWAIIGSAMGSSYTAEVLAQEERLGPSPIVPVDIAWLLDLKQPTSRPPAIDDDRLFIPLVDGTLLALNLNTGAQVWSRHRPVHGDLIVDNGILIVTYEQLLIAFDAPSGRLLWTHRLDQPRITTPAINNGWLVVTLRDTTLAAFRATDGQELWRQKLGLTATATPSISGGRVYVPLERDSAGAVRALDLSTGNYVWEQTLTGIPGQILALDAIFVGATDNFFYRLRLDDGRVDWYVRTGGDIYGLAAIDEERIYVTSLDNIVRALDRENGAQRWRMPLQGRPESGPIRVENALVLSGLVPNVQMFHTETGRPMGRLTADNELAMPLRHIQRENPEENRTILLTRSGGLMVLKPATGPQQLPAEFPLHPVLPAPSVISQNEVPFLVQPLLPAGPPISHARRFTVQVAIYDRSSAAEETVNVLRDKGYPAFLTTGRRSRLGTLRRVRVGQSLGHGHAMRLIEQLHIDGVIDARLVTTTN
jgi:outer membrane protein assembly factor BamB